LGSGNHFLEVQVADRVCDAASAEAFGLHALQVCVMIHAGLGGWGTRSAPIMFGSCRPP
jgi:tRNA-splicing ligase RtcB